MEHSLFVLSDVSEKGIALIDTRRSHLDAVQGAKE